MPLISNSQACYLFEQAQQGRLGNLINIDKYQGCLVPLCKCKKCTKKREKTKDIKKG